MSKNTNLSFLTDYITADITNGRIGINNASPTVAFDVVGATKITGVLTLTGALGGTSASFSSSVTNAGLIFNTNDAVFSTAGSITKHSVVGLVLKGVTASVFDFSIYSASGTALMTNPTGTNNIGFPGGPATFSSSVTANQISSIVTSGTARITIGDGAVSGGSLLNLGGISGGKTWFLSNNYNVGGALEFIQSTTNGGTTPASSSAMIITSSGNVGIGTTSPSAKLDVIGNIRSFISNIGGLGGNISLLNDFGNNGGHTLINMQNAGTICWIKAVINGPNSNSGADLLFATPSTDTNGTERMRITSGGELLIGKTSTGLTTNGVVIYNTTTNSGQIFGSIPNSANTYHVWDTTNGVFRFYVSGGGTINASNPVISAISDQRLKENITDLEIGLDAIMALRPRKFDWKKKSGNTGKNLRGFIAQEFEQVFPDLIDKSINLAPEGEEAYKQIRVDLMPVLVKAIQEQQVQIQELSAEITILKNK